MMTVSQLLSYCHTNSQLCVCCLWMHFAVHTSSLPECNLPQKGDDCKGVSSGFKIYSPIEERFLTNKHVLPICLGAEAE